MLPNQDNSIMALLKVLYDYDETGELSLSAMESYMRVRPLYPLTTYDEVQIKTDSTGEKKWRNSLRYAHLKAIKFGWCKPTRYQDGKAIKDDWRISKSGSLKVKKEFKNWKPEYRKGENIQQAELFDSMEQACERPKIEQSLKESNIIVKYENILNGDYINDVLRARFFRQLKNCGSKRLEVVFAKMMDSIPGINGGTIVTKHTWDDGVDCEAYILGSKVLKILAQVKNLDNKAEPADMRDFAGAMELESGAVGFFFSLSGFSKRSIIKMERSKKIELYDFEKVFGLCLNNHIGIKTETININGKGVDILNVDDDFFNYIRENNIGRSGVRGREDDLESIEINKSKIIFE